MSSAKPFFPRMMEHRASPSATSRAASCDGSRPPFLNLGDTPRGPRQGAEPPGRPFFRLIRLAGPLLLAALGAVTIACGIGSDYGHQEPLSKMRITGTRVAGQEMQLELDLRQTYDVDVDVECDLKQGGEVIQQIGNDTVPANPDGRPGEEPAFGSSLVFPFRVEKAGSYVVVCFTPADAENDLTASLSISAR